MCALNILYELHTSPNFASGPKEPLIVSLDKTQKVSLFALAVNTDWPGIISFIQTCCNQSEGKLSKFQPITSLHVSRVEEKLDWKPIRFIARIETPGS